MLSVDEIRTYWEARSAGDPSAQSTTDDVYLREIELRVLREQIERLKPASVVDIGCGDGRTTIGIAKKLTSLNFSGFDYSESMVNNARANLTLEGLQNVIFGFHDILNPLGGCFDLAFTTRCLINLPGWEMQRLALRNIHEALQPSGYYLMIENFKVGQENFNRIRKDFGLPEIPVRNHNLFFDRTRLCDDIAELFSVEEEVNISSSYYMVSRVIYSRICADNGVQPDYFNDHHRYASVLPFSGEFGPVRLLVLKKK
jgi:SAM-dependent methyltransferase